MRLEPRGECVKESRRDDRIRVEHEQIAPACLTGTTIHAGGEAIIARVRQDRKSRELCLDLRGAPGITLLIDEDRMRRDSGLGRLDCSETAGQLLIAAIVDDDNRYDGGRSHGQSAAMLLTAVDSDRRR
jgi:hypothetical protein